MRNRFPQTGLAVRFMPLGRSNLCPAPTKAKARRAVRWERDGTRALVQLGDGAAAHELVESPGVELLINMPLQKLLLPQGAGERMVQPKPSHGRRTTVIALGPRSCLASSSGVHGAVRWRALLTPSVLLQLLCRSAPLCESVNIPLCLARSSPLVGDPCVVNR